MSGLKYGKTGVPSHAYPIMSRIKGLKGVIPVISSLRKFDTSDVAKERMKILSFYDRYGERATTEAFGVSRKTIWVWKKRLDRGHDHLVVLTPTSTRPKMVRSMMVDYRLVTYIRSQRELYPKRSKVKLKPFVDAECQRRSLSPIATSTIGKVIKRNNMFFFRGRHIYHNPASKWAENRQRKRIRVKHAPKPVDFGHLEMDTVTRIVDSMKVYLYTAIDIRMKFSFAYPYTRLNSRNTVDFFKKLQMVFPVPVVTVQTDNGLEFLGDFDAYLERQEITHAFTYPRCPRINGVVERFNRTISEELLEPNLHLLHDPLMFCAKLVDWLIYYNCYRVHQSLGLQTPMGYLISEGGMSNMSVACTPIC
jgi:putative transposase